MSTSGGGRRGLSAGAKRSRIVAVGRNYNQFWRPTRAAPLKFIVRIVGTTDAGQVNAAAAKVRLPSSEQRQQKWFGCPTVGVHYYRHFGLPLGREMKFVCVCVCKVKAGYLERWLEVADQLLRAPTTTRTTAPLRI